MSISTAAKAFSRTIGLDLCFKIFHPALASGTSLARLTSELSLHRSAFCRKVKRSQNEECKQCDLRDVPARCSREKNIFIHTCHAGACEAIVPVFAGETLVGVAYLGQFRRSKKQPEQLPLWDAARRQRLLEMARVLQSYLAENLQTPAFSHPASKDYRRETIVKFLRQELRTNPSLGELGRHLGITASRAGHAVREATGLSFVQLRDQLRLEKAEGLLTGSYYKVVHIASECGFASAEYFHRFFRSSTGLTPLAFRKRQRAEA